MDTFNVDDEKYELLNTELTNPGLHLVRIPIDANEDFEYPLENGEAGILFTGHSNIDTEILQSSGIFFSIEKTSDIVENGTNGDVFDSVPGFKGDLTTCVWCNQDIDYKDSTVKLKDEKVHKLFDDITPTFHSSCFLEFRYHLKQILDNPEIVSHSI